MGNKVLIQDLAEKLSANNHLSKNVSDSFVKAFFETIVSVLEKENSVKVKGLGTFKLVGVESRESVNVNTGERIRIDEHQKVVFTPETALKQKINKPFEQFETVVINDGVDINSMESLDNREVETASRNAEPDSDVPAAKAEVAPDEKFVDSDEDEQSTDSGATTKIEHVIPPVQMQLEIKKDEAGQDAEKQAEALAHEKRENKRLKFFLLLLVACLLCIVSYFAGYYRLLCPDCTEQPTFADREHAALSGKVPSSAKPVHMKRKPSPSLQKNEGGKAPTASRQSSPPIAETKKTEKVEKPQPLDPSLSYRMVSTMTVHEMQSGENLYRIAQKYYGSKKFAMYIIRYNGFEDPDVVPVGTRVKIPRLER